MLQGFPHFLQHYFKHLPVSVSLISSTSSTPGLCPLKSILFGFLTTLPSLLNAECIPIAFVHRQYLLYPGGITPFTKGINGQLSVAWMMKLGRDSLNKHLLCGSASRDGKDPPYSKDTLGEGESPGSPGLVSSFVDIAVFFQSLQSSALVSALVRLLCEPPADFWNFFDQARKAYTIASTLLKWGITV